MFFLTIVFYVSIFILLSCYFIYPAVLFILYRLFYYEKKLSYGDMPTVTLITSLCNEDYAILAETLKNRKSLEYPKDKLKLLFVADGSTETIRKVIKPDSFERISLFEVIDRKGKTNALNKAIPYSKSDILVFSDANSIYKKDALQKLARHFANPAIGGVCGELRYIDEEIPDMTGKISNIYLKYEQIIKILESKVTTLTVFNGAIYAMRRHLHQEMNPQAANDFQHPMQIILQGYRSIYEPEAIAFENTVNSDLVEFRRTVRITSRGWKGFFSYPEVINPLKTRLFSIQFIFRKLLRWLSPIFLLATFISSFLLIKAPMFLIIFILQLFFYVIAFAGWFFRERKLSKVLLIPYFFCLVNLAALFGLFSFIAGKDSSIWIPSTRSQ